MFKKTKMAIALEPVCARMDRWFQQYRYDQLIQPQMLKLKEAFHKAQEEKNESTNESQ